MIDKLEKSRSVCCKELVHVVTLSVKVYVNLVLVLMTGEHLVHPPCSFWPLSPRGLTILG